MKLTVIATLWAALLTSSAGAPTPGTDRDGRELVEAAQQAMTEGRFGEALDLYGQAGELGPLRAEIPYNMGVAAYRQGDLVRAAELFDQARLLGGDPSMQASAAYNLGTTAARSAMESQEQDAAIAEAQMQNATDSLKSSLDYFRQAIEADPGDVDARANGELAWRWLQQLQEQMEQQDQDSDQDPDENQDQPNQEQQSPQDGQQDPEQEQEQEQQQQGDEAEQQGAEGEQEQEQQSSPQQQEQAQQDERPDSTERKSMSPEEADRLLQSVRDKEARRREELARQEASRRRPVDKDW